MNENKDLVATSGDQAESTTAALMSAAPGLMRVAATTWWRTVRWATATSASSARRAAQAVAAGESPTQVAAEAGAGLRSAVLDVLGLRAQPSEGDQSRPREKPSSGRSHDPAGRTWLPKRQRVSVAELRARGAALLHDAADVWYEDEAHPAYARILDELSPDEARILCLLATEGAQPAIDIRTNRPLGVGSELVAGGLSMIGLQAGVRRVDRTRANLNNLYRLGLVWFSREQVADPSRYQVVEVQPDVLATLKQAGRSPKIVRRSIHLTPFGEDFCSVCLPSPHTGASDPAAETTEMPRAALHPGAGAEGHRHSESADDT